MADGAAAAVVAPYASCTRPPLAKLLMATAVGVSPHTMGIGPVPAIELLLRRSGLRAVRETCGTSWDVVSPFLDSEPLPVVVKPVESAGCCVIA